jgi:hypothetical protein
VALIEPTSIRAALDQAGTIRARWFFQFRSFDVVSTAERRTGVGGLNGGLAALHGARVFRRLALRLPECGESPPLSRRCPLAAFPVYAVERLGRRPFTAELRAPAPGVARTFAPVLPPSAWPQNHHYQRKNQRYSPPGRKKLDSTCHSAAGAERSLTS